VDSLIVLHISNTTVFCTWNNKWTLRTSST